MARRSVALQVRSSAINQGNGGLFGFAGHVAEVLQSVASTTVDANIATLVADGASPTQAHVTTLNTNWAALLAGLPGVPANKDIVISFDAATVVNMNVLRRGIAELLKVLESGGTLTAG
jgi:hypothetical protein